MRRYLRLLAIQLRASTLLAMQYRFDFFIDGLLSLFWTVTALMPLLVVFGRGARASIAGWSFGEALMVTGWFTLLQGVIEGVVSPSLTNVVEHVRKGTLDFVLIKPADAQFLVSTARFLPWRVTNLISALAIFGYGFHLLGRWPSPLHVGQALLLALCATATLYSLWIVTVSAAFYVVKVDNLTYLFSAVFDAARWPKEVFRGFLSALFTFVIPLALMTTYPARALLGSLEPSTLALSLGLAALFAVLSRRIWLLSIGKYTSASS